MNISKNCIDNGLRFVSGFSNVRKAWQYTTYAEIKDGFWYAEALKNFDKACDAGDEVGCKTAWYLRGSEQRVLFCYNGNDWACNSVKDEIADIVKKTEKKRQIYQEHGAKKALEIFKKECDQNSSQCYSYWSFG